jgi:ElaB/YqjD/DUF883 family membrane-anchored ribosome-binding protein
MISSTISARLGATHEVKTFASELEAMAKRNPLGSIAGAVVVGVLIGLLAGGRSA